MEWKEARKRFCGIQESRGIDNCELQRLEKVSMRGDQVPLNSAGYTDNMDEEESEERERRREEKGKWEEREREREACGTTGKVSSNSKAVESRKNRRNEDIR